MAKCKSSYSILAISKHDLRYPVHGSARLLLSILGALSYCHDILYIGIRGVHSKSNYTKLRTEFRGEYTSFDQITLSHHYRSYLSIFETILDINRNKDFVPDIVLCASREFFPLCMILARKYGSVSTTLQDALRYLYIISFLKAIAIPWYMLITGASDLSICVTEDIEAKLRRLCLGLKRDIYTIRPTFMLLANKDRDSSTSYLLDQLEKLDTPIYYSGPADLLSLLASKFPYTLFIVTGPLAYHVMRSEKANKLKNIMLLHNVPDNVLKIVHNKVLASVVVRPVMTGISMTILQSLYFGVPIIANEIAVLGYEDIVNKYEKEKILVVFSHWGELIRILKDLSSKDKIDLKFKERIIKIFDENFSPTIFSIKFNTIMNKIISSSVWNQK